MVAFAPSASVLQPSVEAWPTIKVYHEAALDLPSTVRLLENSVKTAFPAGAAGATIKRIVLNCLVASSVTYLKNGHFEVSSIRVAQLGSPVRAACAQAGDSAWTSYELYGCKLQRVLDELQEFVARMKISATSAVALLRADVLVALLACSRAGTSSTPRRAQGQEQPQLQDDSSGGNRQREKAKSPAAGSGKRANTLGPLVFEVHDPGALPIHVKRCNPGTIRFAINRAILACHLHDDLETLSQSVLASVLHASTLQRSAEQHELLELSSCSARSAQQVLDTMLETRPGALALFNRLFQGSLRKLLEVFSTCARLVHVAEAPGGKLSLLLRVDLLLKGAVTVKRGLPSSFTNPGASPAAIGESPPVGQPSTGEVGPASVLPLLRRLLQVHGEWRAKEVGINETLVGRFMAAHCLAGEDGRGLQVRPVMWIDNIFD